MQVKFHLKNLADIYAAEIRVYDTLNSDDKSNPAILTSAWAPESWILVRDINHEFEGAIVIEVAGMRWAWIENEGETGRWYASSKEDNFSSYCSVFHKESSDGSAQYEKPQELTFLKINPFKVIIKDIISYDSKDFQINYIFNSFGVLWQAEDWGIISSNCCGLHFDGVDDYVKINDSPSLNISDEITIEAFVRPSAVLGYHAIYISGQHKYQFLRVENGKVLFRIWDNSGNLVNLYSLSSIDANRWYHFAATFDREEMKIYINGILDNSKFVPTPGSMTIVTGGYKYVGVFNAPSNNPFQGDITHVGVYNRALNDAEISQMYDYVVNRKGGMITDGLVLWYDGDSIDIENGIWHDKSGNGNDGTIYGATKCLRLSGEEVSGSVEELKNYKIIQWGD